jgi:hypothetical protein
LHLLLGDPRDLCCSWVRDRLDARGYPTRVVANLMAEPSRFSWWLETRESRSSLVWGEQAPVCCEEIAGVLVLGAGLVDPSGWRPADLAYVQAETQAALLAWLWSLACPVVNRYPPQVWYRPQAPLLSWCRLLERCGLPTLPTLVTNVEADARAFAREHAAGGLDGAVYGPLTSEVRYLVTSEDDWEGLAALQKVTPVCLSAPHGEPQRVCVVGDRVVWDRPPSPDLISLEPSLSRFAAAAGLAFVELSLAPASEGVCVVAVETHPRLEAFAEDPQAEIVERIVQLLTEKG